MTFSTRNFDPLTPLAPKFPNFATQIWLFRLKHTVAVVTHAHVLQNFYTTWVLGVACQKTTFRTKIGGGGLGQGSIQKIWDPLHSSATVEANNFKFGTQIGFGTSLPKNELQDQNWRGPGLGEHPKKFGTPYLFLQPLKLATSNLVHNLGSGLAYQKTTTWTKIGGGLGQGIIQKFLGPRTYFCNR